MPFALKRVYEAPSANDGHRILVDRLWPRGTSKENAQLSEWCRDIAPSDDLRKEFHGKPDLWPDFCKAYAAELDTMPNEVKRLQDLALNSTVTLLYASKSEERNNAVALRAYLES